MSHHWWQKFLRGIPAVGRRHVRGPTLNVEALENRIAPVLGATGEAALVWPASQFDGVAYLIAPLLGEHGSGSLLTTDRHILTAAHVAAGASFMFAFFDLTRDDPVYHVPINMRIPIIVSAHSQIPHPAYATPAGGSDIAIVRLHDQEAGLLLPDRHLVAPFRAQRYHLFPGANELDVLAVGEVTLVGYGEDGRGNDGNYTDEVQRLTITGIPVGGGSFTLTLFPPTGTPIQTDPINTMGLTPQILAQAFVNRGVSANNIAVAQVPGAPEGSLIFDIRFTGTYGGTNINPLGYEPVPPMNGTVAERWPGRVTYGVKRMGRNTYDALSNHVGASNIHLAIDFDNGQAANNAIAGSNLGVALDPFGFGEVSAGRVDSGGPGFLWNAMLNRWEIAGVISYGYTTGSPIDVTDYRDATNAVRLDSSFGETAYLTRVSQFLPWISQQVAGSYHVVLDMQQQILGNDRSPITGQLILEQYTITARRNGNNLELVVNNPSSPECSGVYFSQPIASIRSLTIRGADDDETIRIEGQLWRPEEIPLGETRPITIWGRGGNDTIIIGATGGGNLGDYFDPFTINGGDGNDTLIINDLAAVGQQTYTVSATTVLRSGFPTRQIGYANVEQLTLNAGNGGNPIDVEGTRAGTGTIINAGNGGDTITVANSQDRIDDIQGALTINGQGGTNTLTIDDRGSPRGQLYNYSPMAGTLRRGTGPLITYTNTPNPTIRTGNQPPGGMGMLGNTIDVVGAAASSQATIIGSDGNDVIKSLRAVRGGFDSHG